MLQQVRKKNTIWSKVLSNALLKDAGNQACSHTACHMSPSLFMKFPGLPWSYCYYAIEAFKSNSSSGAIPPNGAAEC